MLKLFSKFKNFNIKRTLKNVFLVILGNLILAFGSAVFLIELDIITGGLSGIGIIVQYFVGEGMQVVDIFVFIATWILWIFGLFFLGKDFALKTIISAILYPLFLSLFLRLPILVSFSQEIAGTASNINDVGRTLLCGIFGGVAVGTGVGLSFLGGASTGGIDIIAAIIEKKLKVKASVIIFIIDACIVLSGMIFVKNYTNSLIGVISAFLCATTIDVIYNGSQSCFIAEIISDKWEAINKYCHEKLERGTTIIYVKGGYKGQDRVVLKVVFDKTQYFKIRNYIKNTDPKAFVTYTQTNAVFGEGFSRDKTKEISENPANHE